MEEHSDNMIRGFNSAGCFDYQESSPYFLFKFSDGNRKPFEFEWKSPVRILYDWAEKQNSRYKWAREAKKANVGKPNY